MNDRPFPGVSVHLHGWRNLPCGSQEYCDENPDGWSTYVRHETPDDPRQPFNISNEQDHATLQDARERAGGLAQCLFNDPEDWNHD